MKEEKNNLKEEKNNLKEEKNNFRRNFYTQEDAGKTFFYALILPNVIGILFSFIVMGIAGASGVEIESIENALWFVIPSALIGQVCFFLIYLFYNKNKRISYNAVNVNFKIGKENTFICILIAIVALFGLQYFIAEIDYVLSLIGYHASDINLPLENFGWFTLNVILLAVLPAICEELIFRGMVLGGLRRNFSDKGALFLSALMFALMHGNLQQLVYPFIMGLIFGWVVIRTGSTFSSMIVHFINNFLVILFSYIQVATGKNLFASPSQWYFHLIAFLMLALTIVSLWLIEKYCFRKQNQRQIEKNLAQKPSGWIYVACGISIFLLIFTTVWNFT